MRRQTQSLHMRTVRYSQARIRSFYSSLGLMEEITVWICFLEVAGTDSQLKNSTDTATLMDRHSLLSKVTLGEYLEALPPGNGPHLWSFLNPTQTQRLFYSHLQIRRYIANVRTVGMQFLTMYSGSLPSVIEDASDTILPIFTLTLTQITITGITVTWEINMKPQMVWNIDQMRQEVILPELSTSKFQNLRFSESILSE